MRERITLSVSVLGFFLSGYFGVGWLVADPVHARTLWTPLDGAIPFLLGSVAVYWSILPMGLLPIFTVRDPVVFRRVALAYAGVIAVSLAVFVSVPISSLGFRPDASAYADAGFSGWLLQLLHFLDPPLNLFPSLHLGLALLAALAVRHVDRTLGTWALAWTALIALSVCTTKQHFALDALAGVALGGVAHWLCVARFGPAEPDSASFGRAGLARFAALVAVFYAALYAAHRAGVEPWMWSIG